MTHTITHRAAVLGRPIEHSRSPLLHTAGYVALGLDHWDYGRFDCDAESLPQLMGSLDDSYRGVSVTMPAKFAALAFAEESTERARVIGSANTLVRTDAGWRADNTDVDGIRGALSELLDGQSLEGQRAVVVGAGGTARPAIRGLVDANIGHITVINRSDRSQELSGLVASSDTTVSFTSIDGELDKETARAAVVISTVPSVAIAGIEKVLAQAPVLDVIYDPWPTPLVTEARDNEVPAVGGQVMLACQAYGQFEQFTGLPAPRSAMRAALDASLGIRT